MIKKLLVWFKHKLKLLFSKKYRAEENKRIEEEVKRLETITDFMIGFERHLINVGVGNYVKELIKSDLRRIK